MPWGSFGPDAGGPCRGRFARRKRPDGCAIPWRRGPDGIRWKVVRAAFDELQAGGDFRVRCYARWEQASRVTAGIVLDGGREGDPTTASMTLPPPCSPVAPMITRGLDLVRREEVENLRPGYIRQPLPSSHKTVGRYDGRQPERNDKQCGLGLASRKLGTDWSVEFTSGRDAGFP